MTTHPAPPEGPMSDRTHLIQQARELAAEMFAQRTPYTERHAKAEMLLHRLADALSFATDAPPSAPAPEAKKIAIPWDHMTAMYRQLLDGYCASVCVSTRNKGDHTPRCRQHQEILHGYEVLGHRDDDAIVAGRIDKLPVNEFDKRLVSVGFHWIEAATLRTALHADGAR